MTTHIISDKGHKMQFNGDLLTGDTFPVKEYIKKTLDGKWVADKKGWRVDVSKVNRWLAVVGSGIRVDDAPVANSKSSSAAAPKNMSYAEFARRMDDPNSDW